MPNAKLISFGFSGKEYKDDGWETQQNWWLGDKTLISLKHSRECLISQLKENSCPWKGSRQKLLPIMSNSHCRKHEPVQEPKLCYQYRNWLSCPFSIAVHTKKWFPASHVAEMTPFQDTLDPDLRGPSANSWGFCCAQELWEPLPSQQAYFKSSLLCVGNVERQPWFPQVLAAVLTTQSLFKPHHEIIYWICTQAELVQVPDTWVCERNKKTLLAWSRTQKC